MINHKINKIIINNNVLSLLIIVIIITVYIYNKQKKVNYRSTKIFKVNNKIKVLTYNIERIPIYIRPKVDIDKLMKKCDILCLQENFCNLIGSNKQSYNYNCVIPQGSFYKLIDSGLSIYSKYPIKYIDFIKFNNSSLIESVASKGFLVVQIANLILINTHLQASLSIHDDNTDITLSQLKTILSYVNKHNYHKVLICGDFNLNLKYLSVNGYNTLSSNQPTNYADYNDYLGLKTSATPIKNYTGICLDGGLYKNITVNNIKTVIYDEYSDHKGVIFDII